MPRSRIRPTMVGIILTLAACVAGYAQQPGPPPVSPSGGAELDPVVDKILTRLENREVHDLQAKVRWELRHVIEEDEDATCKSGTIFYKEEQPVAKFKVHFDTKITGNRKQKLDEEHLFDGRWYTELQSQTKTVTRREIRHADEKTNPYKLGEGAFPLPFGQKKADILAEFEVRRNPEEKGDPPDTDHLRLTPRPDTQTGRTYKVLDFWVARAGEHAGLPVKVVAGKKDGTGAVNSYISISFSDIKLNSGLSSSVFKIEAPRDYEVIEERLDPIELPPGIAPAEGSP